MLKGIISLLCAAFFFALSTVFLKFAVQAPCNVPASVTIFARFFMGFLMFSAAVLVKGEKLAPNNARAVGTRAVLNTLAVTLFFVSIPFTTVTKANILNLTYPAFVFLIAPFMTDERQRKEEFLFLAGTLIGAGLVVMGGGAGSRFGNVNAGDMLALASGVVAGFAISGLRHARKFDSSSIILFYQMSFGTLASLFLVARSWTMPQGAALAYVLAAALFSNLGQYVLTEGYRYIGAALGAIVLESGILFAAVLGISIFHDPLTLPIALGGLLILVSITGVAGIFDPVRRARFLKRLRERRIRT